MENEQATIDGLVYKVERAIAMSLCARSGQVTSLQIAENIAKLICEDEIRPYAHRLQHPASVEPVAWYDQEGGRVVTAAQMHSMLNHQGAPGKTAAKEYTAPLYTAPLSAPSSRGTEAQGDSPPNGNWLWVQFMDWCKQRRVHPGDYNDLFAIVGRAREEAQTMSQSDRELMERVLKALEAETDQSWECNSTHPLVWEAIASLRARLSEGESK